MQVEANLQNPRENLQIPYPAGFAKGDKTHADDENIVAGYEPRYYSEAELVVIEAWLPRLNYNQSLIRTGSILVGNDALLDLATHDELDKIETQSDYPNSRFIDTDIERPLRDRVYIVRELGYRGLLIQPVLAAVETMTAVATSDRKGLDKAGKKETVVLSA